MEKENLKEKKVLVYDYGIFTEMAAALVPYFKEVMYFVPWQDAFPSSSKQKIGMDFKGMTRVNDFWAHVDEADLIVSFDTYCGDLVRYLREKGYRVWGAGKAEDLELKRWKMRKMQEKIGMPTQASILLKSIDDVKLYFKGIKRDVKESLGYEDQDTIKKQLAYVFEKYDNFSGDYAVATDRQKLISEWLNGAESKFIKSNMRGDLETCYAEDFDTSLSKLNLLADQLGHRMDAKEVEFVLESKVKGIEPGWDGIQIDGEYLSPAMWGFEIKGGVYIGKWQEYDEMPEPIRKINDQMKLLFKKASPTRSFFSTEFILTKEGVPYLIDPCVRNPAPVGSAIYSKIFTNLGEIIYYGAAGEIVKPEIRKGVRYTAGVSVNSSWAEDHESEVTFEKDGEDWMTFRMAYQKKNKFYTVKGFDSVGAVVGFGKTIKEAKDAVDENSDKVKMYNIDINTGSFSEVEEEAEGMEKITGEKF